MRFTLIDRINELEPGKNIVAVKNLSLAEEYLADHFPGFPVMPGVLMLEAMTQAAAWLIRVTEDFAHSVIVLKQARAVKYGSFVQPGRQLTIHAEIVRDVAPITEIRGRGVIDQTTMVNGRLTLTRYNLRERNPAWSRIDTEVIHSLKRQLPVLAKDLLRSDRSWLRETALPLTEPSVGSTSGVSVR